MIKRLSLVFFITLVTFIKAQTTVVDSIFCGGMYRTYRLYIPAIYTGLTPRPLVFNLHGYTSNALAQQQYTVFEPIADTANFLMVLPQGTKDGSNQTYWNAEISGSGVNDIQFLSDLIDSLSSQYNIDLNRVYSCGLSNGGFMSQSLACELSNRITAIASVAASMYTIQYGSNCHPTRPLPVMQISGTSDGTVPYNGGTIFMHVDSIVKYWVNKNMCNPVATFSNVPNTNMGDGCTAEHYKYNGGLSGSTVELYKVIGGGHTWPGSPFIIGTTNQDFSASKEIWRFFRNCRLDLLTPVEDREKENLNLSVYPNPTKDVLNISFDKEDKALYSVEIIDLLGNLVHSKNSDIEQLDVSSLNSGVYFIVLRKKGKCISVNKLVKS